MFRGVRSVCYAVFVQFIVDFVLKLDFLLMLFIRSYDKVWFFYFIFCVIFSANISNIMLFFVFFNGTITLWLNLLYNDCNDFNLVLSNLIKFCYLCGHTDM